MPEPTHPARKWYAYPIDLLLLPVGPDGKTWIALPQPKGDIMFRSTKGEIENFAEATGDEVEFQQ